MSLRPRVIPGLSGATQIGLTRTIGCILDRERRGWCWGGPTWPLPATEHEEHARTIAAGGMNVWREPTLDGASELVSKERVLCALKDTVVRCTGCEEGQMDGSACLRPSHGEAWTEQPFGEPVEHVALFKGTGLGGAMCGVSAGHRVTCSQGPGHTYVEQAPEPVRGLREVMVPAFSPHLWWLQSGRMLVTSPGAKAPSPLPLSPGTLMPGLTTGALRDVVGCSSSYHCALLDTGKVWCRSRDEIEEGQLVGGYEGEVEGLAGVTRLVGSCPVRHVCAVQTDGDVRCWGDNSVGQLGDGTRRSSRRAVRVAWP